MVKSRYQPPKYQSWIPANATIRNVVSADDSVIINSSQLTTAFGEGCDGAREDEEEEEEEDDDATTNPDTHLQTSHPSGH